MKKIKSIAIAVIIMAGNTTISYAQSTTKTNAKPAVKTEQKDSVYYTCSMHPEVKMASAGKCPKCSMTLEKKIVKEAKKTSSTAFECPMKCEGDKTYDKAGKCPKCGMELTEKKPVKQEKPHGHSHDEGGHHH